MMFKAQNIGLSWKEQRDLDWKNKLEERKNQDQIKRDNAKPNPEAVERRRRAEEIQARKDDDLSDLGW